MPTTKTGTLRRLRGLQRRGHVPLHAWPSEMTTNAFGLPLLPNSCSSFSTRSQPPADAFFDVGVPGRSGSRAETANARRDDRGRRTASSDPWSAAPAAPRAARTAPAPRDRPSSSAPRQTSAGTDRSTPAVGPHVGDVHRRRCVLQDDDVGAGPARRRDPRLRLGDGDDAQAAATSTDSQNASRRRSYSARGPAATRAATSRRDVGAPRTTRQHQSTSSAAGIASSHSSTGVANRNVSSVTFGITP